MEYSLRQISDIREMLEKIDLTLSNATDTHRRAQQLLDDCVAIIEGSTGAPLPVNTTYDLAGT